MSAEAPVIAISGGSRGLGLALVNHFLTEGWRVATFSRSESAAIAACIAAQDGRFLWRAADNASRDDLQAFVRETAETFGRLDALVNNAGVGFDGLLALMREEDVDRLLDINLRGVILLSQLCARKMIRAKRGAIVNISSVNAIRGYSGVSVYSAAKAALDGLTRSLARELGPWNIRVNSVAPGYFESDMVAHLDEQAKGRITRRTPLGRLAEMIEIARTVHFLASGEASFVTGQTLVVDGGLTC